MLHIIVHGNPVEGFEFWGPYPSERNAAEAVIHDDNLPDGWCVAELNIPRTSGDDEYTVCQAYRAAPQLLSGCRTAHDMLSEIARTVATGDQLVVIQEVLASLDTAIRKAEQS